MQIFIKHWLQKVTCLNGSLASAVPGSQNILRARRLANAVLPHLSVPMAAILNRFLAYCNGSVRSDTPRAVIYWKCACYKPRAFRLAHMRKISFSPSVQDYYMVWAIRRLPADFSLRTQCTKSSDMSWVETKKVLRRTTGNALRIALETGIF